MTQKQRIVETLSKRPLTTLDAAILGLGVKLQTRIGEIERELNVKFERKKIKSSYTGNICFKYSAQKKDLKTLKNYLKSDK
jgi:hypothetical protein